MITSKEILDLVAKYVKTQDLDTFAASFAELFYDIESNGDSCAIQLSYKIETELAAITAGVQSEPAFTQTMHNLVLSTYFEQISMELWGTSSINQSVVSSPAEFVHGYTKLSVGFGLATSAPNTLQSNGALFLSQSSQVA